MAKPRPLAMIDTLDDRTKYLVKDGDGKSVLTNKGSYTSVYDIAGTYQIFELNAEQNNQTFQITPKGGYLYLVNSSSYDNISVSIGVAIKGTVINIKNMNTAKTIKIITSLDDISNMIIKALESITIVYTGVKWIII